MHTSRYIPANTQQKNLQFIHRHIAIRTELWRCQTNASMLNLGPTGPPMLLFNIVWVKNTDEHTVKPLMSQTFGLDTMYTIQETPHILVLLVRPV